MLVSAKEAAAGLVTGEKQRCRELGDLLTRGQTLVESMSAPGEPPTCGNFAPSIG